jgi:murein DD-endopeptidase MepM/ murein hydrolase activator NlpD
MNIILLSHRHKSTRDLRLSGLGAWMLLLSFAVVLPTLAFYAGLRVAGIGAAAQDRPGLAAADVAALHAARGDLQRQKQSLQRVRRELHGQMDVLSLEISKLQAQAIRLEALGNRLVEVARLNPGEFDFSAPPALGGPEEAGSRFPDVSELTRALDRLAEQLSTSEERFDLLSRVWLERRLSEESRPSARPVDGGWISSLFGFRTDPFSGKRTMHSGVDFAVPKGTDIKAAAAGIVSFSGWRKGYGRVVEISHGNNLVTRYAHNSKNLVQAGDTVRKHQRIALVGSTGRSTGPHLHFEVIRNGKSVDPMKYLAKR